MKKKRDGNEPAPEDDAVLLEDLAPREDVQGGSGKIPFGQGAGGRQSFAFPEELSPRKRKPRKD